MSIFLLFVLAAVTSLFLLGRSGFEGASGFGVACAFAFLLGGSLLGGLCGLAVAGDPQSNVSAVALVGSALGAAAVVSAAVAVGRTAAK